MLRSSSITGPARLSADGSALGSTWKSTYSASSRRRSDGVSPFSFTSEIFRPVASPGSNLGRPLRFLGPDRLVVVVVVDGVCCGAALNAARWPIACGAGVPEIDSGEDPDTRGRAKRGAGLPSIWLCFCSTLRGRRRACVSGQYTGRTVRTVLPGQYSCNFFSMTFFTASGYPCEILMFWP